MMSNVILAVLLSQLGSEDFGTRERAHKALAQLGPAAHSHLWISQQSKCPETAARSRQMLARWYAENAEALAAVHAPFPWWTWETKWPGCEDRAEYMTAAQKIVGYGARPTWLDERMAAQLFVTDLYRRQYSRKTIDDWLAERWEEERRWKARFMPQPSQ